jgi:DNA-binding response OmpR family regulator
MLDEAGYHVRMVAHGKEALAAIKDEAPDIVLTDLHMPEMNGLELIREVRKTYSEIPVVMMTADGTEDIAAESLRAGAASYLPKRFLERDLLPTLQNLVKMIEKRRTREHVLDTVVESQTTFEFGNDHEFAAALVSHLEGELRQMDYDDATGVFRIILALKEALANAIDHGNLELDSKLRDRPDNSYGEMGHARRKQEPYSNRRVQLTSRLSPNEVSYTIRDQGPGFDPATIPDPRDPENLLKPHGRGMMLIMNFMDEVKHNATGNEITLIKRRTNAGARR